MTDVGGFHRTTFVLLRKNSAGGCFSG